MIAQPSGRSWQARGPRRGMTLIETLVLMTGVAAMLGLAVLMLQLLMKLDGEARGRLEAANALARLAGQFREDVHAGTRDRAAGKDDAQAPTLRIALGAKAGRVVEYQAKGDGKVVRVESGKDGVIRRESYAIPGAGAVRLEWIEREGRPFARLAVARRGALVGDGPSRDFEVLAMAGKNRPAADRAAEGEKP